VDHAQRKGVRHGTALGHGLGDHVLAEIVAGVGVASLLRAKRGRLVTDPYSRSLYN
jgi:hypothetical protein